MYIILYSCTELNSADSIINYGHDCVLLVHNHPKVFRILCPYTGNTRVLHTYTVMIIITAVRLVPIYRIIVIIVIIMNVYYYNII